MYCLLFVLFFKQKTAYEMRISDWSSDVCSSDLKRNYRIIFEGGQLYRLTGDVRYRDHVRDLLLAYADLYPKLGSHPAAANQVPGRLFWQSLNDSVFLVNAVQGYAQIRDALTPSERQRLDDGATRPMAKFLRSDA